MLTLSGKTLDEIAIERLREWEAKACEMNPGGFWLAFSGGKDSVVILDLIKRAGVKFEAHYSLTTVDPPELVRFVKTFSEVRIDRPPKSMWRLIREHHRPPLRQARYCCEDLKERGGDNCIVVTGIRWQESNRRGKRRMIEACYKRKNRKFLNVIIEWSTQEVWNYIHSRGLRYCNLYDEGFNRVGCVLCPMTRDVERHLSRWPKLCEQWRRAVIATWNAEDRRWASAGDYWRWWLDRDASSRIDDSPVLFEDDPSHDA